MKDVFFHQYILLGIYILEKDSHKFVGFKKGDKVAITL